MKKLIGSIVVSSGLAVAALVGIGIWSQGEDTTQAFEANNQQAITSSPSAPQRDGFYILPLPEDRSTQLKADVVDAPQRDGFYILPLPEDRSTVAKADAVGAPQRDGFYILPLPEDRSTRLKADVADAPQHDGFYILPLP